MQPSTQFMRAHSQAEFDRFMEGFLEWCKKFWPEYLSRWEPRDNKFPIRTDLKPVGAACLSADSCAE